MFAGQHADTACAIRASNPRIVQDEPPPGCAMVPNMRRPWVAAAAGPTSVALHAQGQSLSSAEKCIILHMESAWASA